MRLRYGLAAVVLCLLSGVAVPLDGFSSPAPGILTREMPAGTTAPDFSLKDLNGREVRLGDYRGKVVLLSFGATWCPHCRTAVPDLKAIAARYKDKEFVLLSIFIQESGKRVSSFAARYDIAYRILLDENGAVAKAYGVTGIPCKTIIGRDGGIVCHACEDVGPTLAKLLGGEAK